MPFAGFTDTDFEAYAPNKWASNVYNLERLRVKEKLGALAQELSPQTPDPEGPPLAIHVSTEHPAIWNQKQVTAQHVFFARSEEEQRVLFSRNTRARAMTTLLQDPSPLHDQINLSLSVHHGGVDVALRLHPDATVDRTNLVRKVADSWQASTLSDLLAALPPAFTVSIAHVATLDRADLDGERVTDFISAFDRSPTGKPISEANVLSIARTYPRSEVGNSFASDAAADLAALLPLYRFMAWSRQNDFVAVGEALREEKKAKAAKGLGKNDQVRVTKGLFSGKKGVILEADARGQLRVQVGTMVVKLSAGDVTRL